MAKINKSFMKQINLKKGTKLKTYTSFCNQAEKDECFVSCGSPEDMWIMVRFEDEIAFNAWIVSLAV